jgi:hypothetical protein
VHVVVVNADAISVQPRLTNGIVRFRLGGKKGGAGFLRVKENSAGLDDISQSSADDREL